MLADARRGDESAVAEDAASAVANGSTAHDSHANGRHANGRHANGSHASGSMTAAEILQRIHCAATSRQPHRSPPTASAAGCVTMSRLKNVLRLLEVERGQIYTADESTRGNPRYKLL